MRDPYSVLEVAPDASLREIKRQFRSLALRCHPDKNPGNPAAHDTFIELLAAYEALSDPAQRAALDAARQRHVPVEPAVEKVWRETAEREERKYADLSYEDFLRALEEMVVGERELTFYNAAYLGSKTLLLLTALWGLALFLGLRASDAFGDIVHLRFAALGHRAMSLGPPSLIVGGIIGGGILSQAQPLHLHGARAGVRLLATTWTVLLALILIVFFLAGDSVRASEAALETGLAGLKAVMEAIHRIL